MCVELSQSKHYVYLAGCSKSKIQYMRKLDELTSLWGKKEPINLREQKNITQTQHSLMYAGTVPNIVDHPNRRILSRIHSSTGSQCSVSHMYSDICEHFGWLATTQGAQLRTNWSRCILNSLAVLLGWRYSSQMCWCEWKFMHCDPFWTRLMEEVLQGECIGFGLVQLKSIWRYPFL